MDTKGTFNPNENYLEWAKMRAEHDQLDRASTYALIAQAMIAERQAFALERIAAVLERTTGTLEGDSFIRTLIMGR